ncbi:hypothetical protein ACHAXM_006782 [Skeletonema potamos]
MKYLIGTLITSLGVPSYQFHAPFIRSYVKGALTKTSRSTICLCEDITNNDGDNELSPSSDTEVKILQLAQSHFVGQALLTLIRLGVMDVLQNTEVITVDEIISKINSTKKDSTSTINREVLFRCLRLVCTSGAVGEATKQVDGNILESAYFATDMGMCLQSTADQSMAPFILHWLERPLWDAWSQLPYYVEITSDGETPPFNRANGMSASEFYLRNEESCSHRNSVARHASSKEITPIIDAMKKSKCLNESTLSGKVVVDVGGGYGDFVTELKESMPTIGQCHCLDLPHVIADATSKVSVRNKDDNEPTLVSGNMFDPTTIPSCDVIFTKHVLCDFSDEDVIQALLSFRKALAGSKEGKVVIMDATLPNGDDLNGKWNPAVSFDVLLMLSGRRGERSRLEWSNLAKHAGFVVEDVLKTTAVTVDLAVLSLE